MFDFDDLNKIKCCALLDQDIYIDEDPVGHTCYNNADLIYKETWPLCNECFSRIKNEDNRVKLPPFNMYIMSVVARDLAIKALKSDLNIISANKKE